jgi:N-acetylglucosamine-6-phosphate deacetylase
MMRALVAGRLVRRGRVEQGLALLFDERFVAFTPEADIASAVPRIDAGGALITPGLIDVHTHGALGRSYLDADAAAFAVNLEEQARHGVTGVLATTSTAPLNDILRTLQRTRERIAAPRPSAEARLLGAHVEGPYFAAAQAGAQDPAHLRTPDDGSAPDILAYDDVVRILSYAPELPGALELTTELVRRGIVAAAGHSMASDVEVARCAAWGMSHAIHLWSGQSSTWRDGARRVPGMLEASLAWLPSGEVIADGHHLPPTLLRLAYQALGPERLCIVSDTTSGAGLANGSPFTMGEMSYVVGDGVGMMLDGSSFAGSTSFLDAMLKVMVDRVGVPLWDAVAMASRNPARLIGRERQMGSLECGLDADFALWSDDLAPLATFIGGVRVTGTPLEGEQP